MRGLRTRLVLLLLGILAWNSLWFRPRVADDAFISLRYAWNLVHGAGLVYNPGEAVEGYTSLLWVLLGALFLRLGLEPVAGLQAVGLAAGLLTALLTLLLAGRLFRAQPAAELKSLLALALLVLSTSLAIAMQTGLETALFACLLVASVWHHEIELARAGARPWSAALFALAWMTRPEAPVFLLYFVGRRLPARNRAPFGWRDALRLAVFAVPVAIYELWGWLTHGALLPDSRVASTVVSAPITGQGWGWTMLLVGGLLGMAMGRGRLSRAVVLPLSAGLIVSLSLRPDGMSLLRLPVATLPFLYLAIAFGLGELLARSRSRVTIHGLAWLLLIVALGHHGWVQMRTTHPDGAMAGSRLEQRSIGWPFEVAGRLGTRDRDTGTGPLAVDALERLSASEWLATRDIGELGWITMNPIRDLTGRITPAPRAWHERSEASTAALLADLHALRPGGIIVKRDRDAGRRATDLLFDRLQSDPWVSESYLVSLSEGPGAATLTAWRRDLPPVEVLSRLRNALGRVPGHPEMDGRLRALQAAD